MKYLIITLITTLNFGLMAQNDQPAKTVTITAKAEIDVSPDQVIYSLNINQKRPSFEAAYDALDKEINKAINLLIKEKIKKDAIKTTTYNVQKSYRWKGDKRIDDGYTASSRLEAKDELDTRKINKVLSRFGKSSPDLNLNIGFSISDKLTEEINEKLLAMAVKRAKQKAKAICKALDKNLGEIESVVYNEIGVPRPVIQQKSMVSARSMAMEDSANYGSIESVKEIKMNLNIHTVWGIRD